MAEHAADQSFELLCDLVQGLRAAFGTAHGSGALDGGHDEGREPHSLVGSDAMLP